MKIWFFIWEKLSIEYRRELKMLSHRHGQLFNQS